MPFKNYLQILLIALLISSFSGGVAADPVNCRELLSSASFANGVAEVYQKAVHLYQKALTASDHEKTPASSFLSEKYNYKEVVPTASLKDGSIIEGSVTHGGIQPPYRIDLSDPRLQPLLSLAQSLKTENLDPWKKIESIRSEIQRLIPGRSYNSISYHLLLRKFRVSGKPIGLGDYIDAKSGVCREHALLMHFALQAAGFDPKFQYWNTWRKFRSVVVHEDHAANTIVLGGEPYIADSYFNAYNGKKLSELMNSDERSPSENYGIIRNAGYPKIWLPVSKKQDVGFSVASSDGHDVSFAVINRSAADRTFAEDQTFIDSAGAEDLVPVEWVFLPYYRPLGHGGLRIGTKLYEFTGSGWKIHESGSDSARGFLFSNPLFKRRVEYYGSNMPFYSIAMPMYLKKSVAVGIDQKIRSEKETETFSLLFNNCNNRLLESSPALHALVQNENGYFKFSSILTFQKILFENPLPTGQARIYPLSGKNDSYVSYKEQFPDYLYPGHKSLQELERTVKEYLKGMVDPEPHFLNLHN